MAEDFSHLKEAEQRSVHCNQNWTGGVILIGLGFVFLLNNLSIFPINNGWALFILVPAFINLSKAWGSYQRNGRLTHGGRGALTGGLILLLLGSTFLFGWSWHLIWPLFLVIFGLAALAHNY